MLTSLVPFVVLISSLIWCCSSGPVPNEYGPPIRFEDGTVPNGWTIHSSPSSEYILDLNIALQQPNVHDLERHLYEISDPSHHRYGQHLSKSQVEDLASPSEDSLHLVKGWMVDHGVHIENISYSPSRDWIKISVPIHLAEDLLSTKFHIYTNTKTSRSLIRTKSYSLPSKLHSHISLVQPTTYFHSTQPQDLIKPIFSILGNIAPGDLIPCNGAQVTLNCLRSFYRSIDYVPDPNSGSKIGIAGFLNEVRTLPEAFRPIAPA